MLDSFLNMKKIWNRTMVFSWSWFRDKSGILSVKTLHKVNGTEWRKGCWWNSQKADIQSSKPRVHCPEVSSKAKAVEICRYTIVTKAFFSDNDFCKSAHSYRAIAEMCEEYETFHDRTSQPVVMTLKFLIRAKRDQDGYAFGK